MHSVNIVKIKRQLGFTLIELMLVIVVLALISVYAIKTLRAMSGATVVQKAAQEASNIQQATMAYYVKYTQWPLSLQDLIDKGFLPQTVGGSDPRCSPFTSSTTSTHCGSFAEFTGGTTNNDPKAPYYTISLATPSNDTALAMAAKLPSAWVSGTNNATLNSAIPVPGQISNITEFFKDKGWVVSAGIIMGRANKPASPPPQIYLPRCPKGYEGHYVLIPNLFITANNLLGGSADKPEPYIQLEEFWGNTPTLTNKGLYTIKPTVLFDSYPTSAFDPITGEPATQTTRNSLSYYFMTMCLPTGYWGSGLDKTTGAVTIPKQGQQSQSGYTPEWRNYFSSNGTVTDCPSGGSGCAVQSFPAPQALYNNCGDSRDCSSTP